MSKNASNIPKVHRRPPTMMTTLWENCKVRALATGAGKNNKKFNQKKRKKKNKNTTLGLIEIALDNHTLTTYVKQCNSSGRNQGGSAGLDSKVTLDVQEEVAEVFENSSGEAHNKKGWGDHHPAVTPVGRSDSSGLHLQLFRSPGCCCCCSAALM